MVHFMNIKLVLTLFREYNTNSGIYAAIVTSSCKEYSDNYSFLL